MGVLKDDGILREEHKLLYEFMPGQLSGHPPKWKAIRGSSAPPIDNVETRVCRIHGIRELTEDKDSNKFNAIKLGTEPRIKDEIRRLAKTDYEPEIRYCMLKADVGITVDLEIFPTVWECRLPNEKDGNLLFDIRRPPPEIKNGRITQPNIVFCNYRGNTFPFLDQMDIPTSRCLLNRVIDLNSKRFLYEGKEEKVHANGWNSKDESDWRGRPRFAHDRSNYIPHQTSEVYPPEMENATKEGLLSFWEINGLVVDINSEGVKQAAGYADMIMKNPDKEQRKGLLNPHIQEYFKGLLLDKLRNGKTIEDVMSITYKFYSGLNPSENEEVKLFLLQKASKKPFAKRAIFKVYHCDNLEIANFSIGYFSGKYYDARDKETERPLLRPFPGILKYGDVFDIKRSDGSVQWIPPSSDGTKRWTVFFQTFRTEGLLFVADENELAQRVGTDPLHIHECLHAISHSLIKNIPKHSGIDYGLIREYLFRTKPAFFLYSSEPGEFRTRGLGFLFDHNLDNLIEDTTETLDCPFAILEDSIGGGHREGCGNCTMVPVGCPEFNRGLDRSLALRAFEVAK